MVLVPAVTDEGTIDCMDLNGLFLKSAGRVSLDFLFFMALIGRQGEMKLTFTVKQQDTQKIAMLLLVEKPRFPWPFFYFAVQGPLRPAQVRALSLFPCRSVPGDISAIANDPDTGR
jgi:hypothetical protein